MGKKIVTTTKIITITMTIIKERLKDSLRYLMRMHLPIGGLTLML